MTPVLDALVAFNRTLEETTGETPTSVWLPRVLWLRLAEELSESVRYEADGQFRGQPVIVLWGALRVKCDELLHWPRFL